VQISRITRIFEVLNSNMLILDSSLFAFLNTHKSELNTVLYFNDKKLRLSLENSDSHYIRVYKVIILNECVCSNYSNQ
jgi:hypothetical protein